MIERHVETIFCDDIRQEVNGKLSYIGVYLSVMFVKEFPATLPKLCLVVRTIAPYEKPFGSLTIRVLKDEELFVESSVSEENIAASLQEIEGRSNEEKKDRVQLAQFVLTFSPFRVEGPCRLKVRIQTDKEELRGVSLNIQKAVET